MSLLCKIFGHRYVSHDVTAAMNCSRCGKFKSAIEWPESKLPEIKEYPPMPIIKKANELPVQFNAQLLVELTEIRKTLEKIDSSTRKPDGHFGPG